MPQPILQTGHPTGVVFATDLSLLVPAMALGGVLLWKRRPLGYVLAAAVLIKACTYGLVMIAMSVFTYLELGTIDSLIPLWAFLSAGCIAACILLAFEHDSKRNSIAWPVYKTCSVQQGGYRMSFMELEVNRNAENAVKEMKFGPRLIGVMLFSRTLLFLLIQFILFACFNLAGASASWEQSANWWTLNVAVTNVICVFLLHTLLKREGKSFWDFFEFRKGEILKSFLIMSGLLLLCMPVAYLPNILLGNALFGDYLKAVELVYRPLPVWAAWLQCFVFPLTMPLGELTVYFGYVMPRLEIISKKKWLALTLPVLMLSFQHAALPLLFDARFVLWRLLMFLPFAFFIGLLIRWKPKLFPYILIGHFLIDIMNAVSILTISLAR